MQNFVTALTMSE